MLPHMIGRNHWSWYPRTLRAQLVLLVLTTLVPFVLFPAAVILLYAQQERQTAERGMRETVRALALAVDREVEEVTTGLRVLALSRVLAADDLEGFYPQCLDALRFLPPGAWIVLSDVHGQQLLNTHVPFGTPLPMTPDMEGLRRVVDSGRPSVSDLIIGPVAKRPMITIDVPVFRVGQVRYVLHAALPAETLGRILVEQRLPAGWLGGINDRKQIILATTPGLERFIGEPVTPRMAERSRVAEEGWFPNIAKDGTPVYSVFSRARSTGWTVVLNAPASLIDGPLRRSL
ncbi:MAG: cache domain-containing protein, partial [Candidatus Entotheonellia bacterium]